MVDSVTFTPKIHFQFFNIVGVAIKTASLTFATESGLLSTDIVAPEVGLCTRYTSTVRGAGFIVHSLPVAFTTA